MRRASRDVRDVKLSRRKGYDVKEETAPLDACIFRAARRFGYEGRAISSGSSEKMRNKYEEMRGKRCYHPNIRDVLRI